MQLGVGLTSTVLAKPYAALRMGNHSWVLLPHNNIWGRQIRLAGRTRTQIGTILQHMVLEFKAMCRVMRCDIQGQLSTGHPTAITYTTQQWLHTPTASLISQRPKPIARTARVAQLALFKLLVGAFQFS